MGALPGFGIPGIANFKPGNIGNNIVIAGGADYFFCFGIKDGKRQHVTVLLTFQGSFNIGGFLARFGDRGIHQIPEFTITGGVFKAFSMRQSHGLENNAKTFQLDRVEGGDKGADCWLAGF